VPVHGIGPNVSSEATFPHCDQRVLHAPGECEYCDRSPEWQQLRVDWGIAFTGHPPVGEQISCPSDFRRGLRQAEVWPGNRPSGYPEVGP
jgi:hypothetical protein